MKYPLPESLQDKIELIDEINEMVDEKFNADFERIFSKQNPNQVETTETI